MFKSGKAIVPSNGSGAAPNKATSPFGVEASFDLGANRSRQPTIGVVVINRETTGGNELEISFNNSSDWFIIPPNTKVELPVITHRMQLRGSGGTADYSVLGIV